MFHCKPFYIVKRLFNKFVLILLNKQIIKWVYNSTELSEKECSVVVRKSNKCRLKLCLTYVCHTYVEFKNVLFQFIDQKTKKLMGPNRNDGKNFEPSTSDCHFHSLSKPREDTKQNIKGNNERLSSVIVDLMPSAHTFLSNTQTHTHSLTYKCTLTHSTVRRIFFSFENNCIH